MGRPRIVREGTESKTTSTGFESTWRPDDYRSTQNIWENRWLAERHVSRYLRIDGIVSMKRADILELGHCERGICAHVGIGGIVGLILAIIWELGSF
jgi:hypothetical protein